MASYRWSEQSPGKLITLFNPSEDRLDFDDASISAAQIAIEPNASSTSASFSYGG